MIQVVKRPSAYLPALAPMPVAAPKKVIDIANDIEIMSNRIILKPFHYLCCEVKHTLFITNVVFCDTFSIDSVMNSENIIIENCIFNKIADLKNFTCSKLIIRNCRFNDELHIDGLTAQDLELFNTTHHNDAYVNNVKADNYFTCDVKMVRRNMLFFTNSEVQQCMNYTA